MASFSSIAELAEMSRTLGSIDFVSIDTETANQTRSSLCAIGVALVSGGEVVAAAKEVVNPECDFSVFNTRVHGIDAGSVAGAPLLTDLWGSIAEICSGRHLAFHNAAFDVGVIRSTSARYGLSGFPASVTCTYRLARRVWPTAAGYGLGVLAPMLQIPLTHHDPESDATACALVALAMIREANTLTLEQLYASLGSTPGQLTIDSFTSAAFPASAGTPSLTKQTADLGADESSPLYGLAVCFTGALLSMPRKDARDLACSAGADFVNSMSAKVDLLVVGDADFLQFADGHQTAKLEKAARIRAKGEKGPEIVREADFLQMLAQS